MEILSAVETHKLLPYAKLAEAIRKMSLAGQGEARVPPRTAVPLGAEGTLLVMPAADENLAATKLVTVHPENASRGLPTIQGEMVIMDSSTGRRLGVLDGSAVTAQRTAALSLLAAKTLAPQPRGSLLIVGAGTQGRAHLEAFQEGLGVSKVFLLSRTSEKADALAKYARGLGIEARVVRSVEEVLEEVTMIVAATTSRRPVLPEELPQNMFVAAVGAFNPDMAELPPALIRRSKVVVDTLEGAKEEAGDLIQAERAGAFSWKEATALREALLWPESPPGTVMVIFKSVGHALWDLAAARTAFGHI